MARAILAPSEMVRAERVDPLIVGISFPIVNLAEDILFTNWLIHCLFGMNSGGSENAIISENFNFPERSKAYNTVAFFVLIFLVISTPYPMILDPLLIS